MVEAIPEHIKKHFYYKRVWGDVYRKNRNATFLFLGDVGRGKSWAGLRFCSDLDSGFSVERCVFSVKDFLALMDKGDSRGPLKKGSAILFDEIAGSEDAAMSRDFMSKTNKIMSFVSTVYRKRGYIVVYCAPHLHQIDKNVRSTGITGILHFKGVSVANNKSKAAFYWCFPAWRSGETIMPRPLMQDKDGRVKRIGAVWIAKPGEELLNAYEEKKEQFLESQISKWHKSILKEEDAGAEKKTETEDLKTTARTMRDAGCSWSEVARIVGRSPRTIRDWLVVGSPPNKRAGNSLGKQNNDEEGRRPSPKLN